MGDRMRPAPGELPTQGLVVNKISIFYRATSHKQVCMLTLNFQALFIIAMYVQYLLRDYVYMHITIKIINLRGALPRVVVVCAHLTIYITQHYIIMIGLNIQASL